MADPKPGEPFGLDSSLVIKIDWGLAIARIVHDLRTDFIYAPHLAFLYHRAGEELIAEVTGKLKAGTFIPNLPITIEVPKSSRMRVAVAKKPCLSG